MDSKETNTSMVLIAGVIALIVGGGLGYVLGMNKMDMGTKDANQMSMVESPAIDLRVGMNNLLREHVSSSLDVTRTIAGGASEAEVEGAISAQTANAVAIAEAVGSVYGDEAQQQITEMFVEHIKASNSYARAVAANDQMAKDAAITELNEYLDEISAFFSTAIDGLAKESVYALLQEHENLLNQSVQAYKDGDFTASYELERQALTQVNGIADALTKGIVTTKSDMFKQ